jgi:hypothetical protein
MYEEVMFPVIRRDGNKKEVTMSYMFNKANIVYYREYLKDNKSTGKTMIYTLSNERPYTVEMSIEEVSALLKQ